VAFLLGKSVMKRLIYQVLICLLLLISACQGNYHLVTRVIDGDTIVLENGTRVRYIGINTPERGKPGHKEATEANRKLVEGKKVRLEYDVERIERTNEWKLTIYGPPRTLAYVYVDGIFVNAYLLENGFAEVMTIKPNVRYKGLFRKLENDAKSHQK